MRDMLSRKFEGCCRAQGFNPIPQQQMFVAHDGLQVPAVIEACPVQGGRSRLNRRKSLQLMIAARKEQKATVQEKATGALTPMAS